MTKKSYWELLRDPQWQRKRLEVMQKANFACECCEATDRTLNVHHRLYRKGAKPWEYTDQELICLCEECHESEHAWRSKLDQALAQLDAGDLEFVLGYAEGRLAIQLGYEVLDKNPIPVRSYEHAEGLLAALWFWNAAGDRPSADCLIDHGAIDDMLVCALGEGQMPHPRSKG